MAIMGRTEEQIMVMGNWTSSIAARRYICTSEVTMRDNGKAIALAGAFSPSVVETTSIPKSSSATATAAAGGTKRAVLVVHQDDDVKAPCTKKPRPGSILFTGTIQQLVVVNKLEDVPACPDAQ